MYVIGLTGNVATGKSVVAAMLARLGAQVIDADRLAHSVMAAGAPAHRAIVARFGAGVLEPTGEIDRRALGEMVFRDAAALADLERIVHPDVVAETLCRLAASTRPVAVVEAIKLVEADMHQHCQAVWVVTSPRRLQLARMVAARGLTPAQAALRIDAQPPQEEKMARATAVIDNAGDLGTTWRQVLRAWNAIPGVSAVPVRTPWPPPESFGAMEQGAP
ncbi:MAG TPA: dephospho-CoA kinase [Armatimonadota bacterium]|nr:dephospho-CoA kinase [Armatimonadota bacterium]